MAKKPDDALFYCRGFMTGAIFLPALGYHHFIALLNLKTPARMKFLRYFVYPVSIFFLITNFTPLFVANVGKRMFFPYWPIPGLFFHFYMVFLMGMLIVTCRTLFSLKASPNHDLGWVLLATAIGWISGGINFFLWYNIPIPPYTNILVSLYILITCLLFFRLGFVDVKSVFRHISVVLLIYGSLLGLSLPIAIPLMQRAITASELETWIPLTGFALLIGTILSVGPFIYAYFVRNNYWLRGTVATGLTHELKSPLGVLQGTMDLLREQMASGRADPEKSLAYMDMAQKNIDRLENTVKGLLNVAKIQEDNISLHKSQFDFVAILRHLTDVHRPLADGKNIQLTVSAPDQLEWFGDGEKLEQAVSNLISNALKFSTFGTVRVELKKNDKEIQLSVQDQGPGLSPKDLPKIFDRFYQAKPNSKGTGIGLTIAKAWVEAHGGKIWAESEGEGKGTTVTFTLPAHY